MKKHLLNKFFKIFLFIFFLFLLSGVSAVSFLSYVTMDLPDVKKLASYDPPLPSQILAQNGEVLLSIGKEKRQIVKIKDIPPLIINSFLSAEDANFYDHKGVDYLGIVRALIADVKAMKIVQGGSTITQQVAKSLLLSKEKSVTRKIKDILLAQKIEKEFTKDEILFLYLNHVYLGGGYYGIKAAFHGYFDKELTEVNIAEAAMVAGLLVAPGKYSPYVSPEYAKMRQRYVLKRMLENKKITEAQYKSALHMPLKIRRMQNEKPVAGHFADWIRQRVINVVGEDTFLTGGLKIVTTIDSDLQKNAEKIIMNGVKAIDKRQGFKGPIRKLTNNDQIEKYLISYRKNFYKEKSQYFTLNHDGKIVYELEFDDQEFQTLVKDLKKNNNNQKILTDRMQQFFQQREHYEAVVLSVSDEQKMIYVSVGGVKGIIPHEHFKWAHPRVISEVANYQPEVSKPSKILKRGDVVLVSLEQAATSLWDHLPSDYKKNNKNAKNQNNLQNQKYYVFKLDQEPEVEGALVAMEASSGKVLTMVGGSDFTRSQFNRAIQSKRQPGSSFKPLLFAIGLEEGYTPAEIIVDSPEALGGADDKLSWKPKNYDGSFEGAMTFRRALEQSRNVPTIKIAADVGIDKIKSFSRRIGLNANLPSDLSIALGSFGVTLMDLINSYAVFPNGGKRVVPKTIVSITDRFGKSYATGDFEQQFAPMNPGSSSGPKRKTAANDSENDQAQQPAEATKSSKNNKYLANLSGTQVYDPRLAYIMCHLMKGVVQSGTGASARELAPFVGGKTGTTNDYVDAWFVGFSSQIVAGVWTGFDDNKSLGWGETGGKAALPIWKTFMKNVLKKYGQNEFPQPNGIVNVLINKETGQLATSEDKNPFVEAFVEGTEPGRQNKEGPAAGTEFNEILKEDDYFINQ